MRILWIKLEMTQFRMNLEVHDVIAHLLIGSLENQQ